MITDFECQNSLELAPTVSLSSTEAKDQTKVRLITREAVLGVVWASDGKSVIYAVESPAGASQGVGNDAWYEFNLDTGNTTPISPPISINPDELAHLSGLKVRSINSLWLNGAISPSARNFVYARVKPGYVTPENTRKFPPIEIWMANLDEGQALKIGGPVGCAQIESAVWFENEKRLIAACGYEGPPTLYIIDNEDRALQKLSDVTAFKGTTGFGSFRLSPDATNLAITDLAYILQIVPLDGSGIQPVTQWGYHPRWSTNGRHLYYLKGQRPDLCRNASLHMYDLSNNSDSQLLDSPIALPGQEPITITCGGIFEVSPREDAAAIWSNGLWLIQGF